MSRISQRDVSCKTIDSLGENAEAIFGKIDTIEERFCEQTNNPYNKSV